MLKKLWAGCFLLVALFSPWALASAGSANLNGIAYEENPNIFLKADGKATQLTNTGRDSEPILSPDSRWVAFSRGIKGEVKECFDWKEKWVCAIKQLWIINLETNLEHLLVKPWKDAPEISKVIGGFSFKTFSPDSKTVFFQTSARVPTGAIPEKTKITIHAVDVNGENERFITYGGDAKIIRSAKDGRLIGHLVVGKDKRFLGKIGTYMYWLITPEGKELGAIGKDTKYFTKNLGIEYMERDGSHDTERLATETIEKNSHVLSALADNLNLKYGANLIDLNADGLQDIVLKMYWDNSNAHSSDTYMIALNAGGTFLEIPLGDDAKYSITTTEGASCLGQDISYLRDFSFRKNETGWLEVTEFRRGFGKSYGDSQSVTITTYKLVKNPDPLPGFAVSFLKPIKKYVTREKYCDVRELMK